MNTDKKTTKQGTNKEEVRRLRGWAQIESRV
jgi:hypothetical protein